MGEGKFSITSKVTEQELMEWCLSLRHSGYDPMLYFGLHALANRWHINKLLYYVRLLEL